VHRLAIDMSAPEPERRRAYLEAANRIERHILADEIMGYICLGDITLYSSFGYVAEIIEKRGYRVDFIPGVSSISAAAAKSHTVLAQGNERLLIMTSSALRDKDDPLSIDANKAIVKLDKHYGRLWKRMQESDEYDAVLCERVGLENERIISPLEANTNPSYLSLALIRKKDKDTI
jgi:precorrin-2/cobalt-factor-2 C20-methyltransferase